MLRHDMPGIITDIKPHILDQTHFILSQLYSMISETLA